VIKRLKKMATFAKGKTLDVGFASLPNPYLQGYIIGLDIKRQPCPPNYSLVLVGDIEEPCFAPFSFDTILAGEFIEHLEQPVKFLRDCRSLLQTGGTLVLSTPNPYYPPIILLNWFMIRKYFYSSDHVLEIAPRYMVRLLERTGFTLRKMLSGGMLLPIGRNRYLTIPVPKSICYHMIYVADAV
jgi:2-polyprenyl-3-methyl-5-hydroxy-6-metoxy-1,4-benzoquinol methylase